MNQENYLLDHFDHEIIKASQAGLPLQAKPYHAIAAQLGLPADEVMRRIRLMLNHGVMRRIAAVPNHYNIGIKANAMTVWDVADDCVNNLGLKVGQLDYVSHCYLRPRHLPDWPFNLFAMVHASDKQKINHMVKTIQLILGDKCRAHELLYSLRILKKTGMRI